MEWVANPLDWKKGNDPVFGLYQLLQLIDIDPAGVRFVRHQTFEADLYEIYRKNRPLFEAYQSHQTREVFRDTKHILAFVSLRGTKALFLGIYEVVACYKKGDAPPWLIKKTKTPEIPEWGGGSYIYDLKRTSLMEELSERLIVDWGGATRAWVQKKDKRVLAIRQKGEIEPFKSYGEILLLYLELKEMVKNPGANLTWKTALSAVNGIYGIVDKVSGKIYVGAAYGKEGVWGRWIAYATNGHGGNIELTGIDPHRFQFIILEILPRTATENDAFEAECRWKQKLLTRNLG